MMTALIEQMLLALPLVLGAYISYSLLKLPDLSLESAYLFGAVTAVIVQEHGGNLFAILIVATAGGALVGLISSSLNQFFKLPFLLASIITNGLFHGLTQYCLGTSLLSIRTQSPPILDSLSGLLIIGTALTLFIGLGLRSQLGVSYDIFGNNPSFFRHYGISTKYIVMSGVMLADALAGISGYLFAHANGFVDLSMAYGLVLLCITALILGKVTIQKPRILMPLAGLLGYFILQHLLLALGMNLKYFNAFQALFVLTALLAFNKRLALTQSRHVDHLGV
ncbi:MAG: hypothetical protein LLG04_15445 [Parachlamydia sp.]|nr:hypothetical protein [Parachlamydia sp.]